MSIFVHGTISRLSLSSLRRHQTFIVCRCCVDIFDGGIACDVGPYLPSKRSPFISPFLHDFGRRRRCCSLNDEKRGGGIDALTPSRRDDFSGEGGRHCCIVAIALSSASRGLEY